MRLTSPKEAHIWLMRSAQFGEKSTLAKCVLHVYFLEFIEIAKEVQSSNKRGKKLGLMEQDLLYIMRLLAMKAVCKC